MVTDSAYKIIPLYNQGYSYFVILCNANSPFNYVNDIMNEIGAKTEPPFQIIVDQILHVGNNDKRFISLFIDSDNEVKKVDFVCLKKKNPLRKATCDFLKKNDLLNNTVLTSVQIRMIKKGIVI